MKTIRWGIIGCGNVTEVKSGPALQLAKNSSLIAVMRRNGDKAADYAKRHGVPKWYDDAENWEEAAVVTVTEPEETPNIDVALSIGGSISGRVVTEAEGEPVAGAWVCVNVVADSFWFPTDPVRPNEIPWDQWGCAETDKDGYYVVTGLITGEYYVHAWAEDFLPQWYDGVQFREDATPVTVLERGPAPLAGALFASEVLYRELDIEHEQLVPTVISSIIAYSVFAVVYGFEPLFVTPGFVHHNPAELLPYFMLALVVAFGAVVYVKTFYTVRDLFLKIRIPPTCWLAW